MFDAQKLDDYFEENELEGVYLLFSDPYKKKKHMKKRVVNQKFLAKVSKVLKENRYFVIKTDHPDYFDEIAKEIEETPCFEQIHLCQDFKDSEYSFSDVKTHYEEKFSFRGIRHTVLRNIKG
jgi:tRNA (guanine-N7-)-methyltransferase